MIGLVCCCVALPVVGCSLTFGVACCDSALVVSGMVCLRRWFALFGIIRWLVLNSVVVVAFMIGFCGFYFLVIVFWWFVIYSLYGC